MCDDYCCNYGCNQGRSCPARIKPVDSEYKAWGAVMWALSVVIAVCGAMAWRTM